MKRPLEYALWCDCETDDERAEFLHSGRAVETGIVAPILAPELAEAFLDRARFRAEVERLKAQVLTLQTEYVRQNPCTDPQDEIDELRREVERLKAENAKLEADAKLGRMVRGMPEAARLCRGRPEEGDRRDWYCFWGNDDRAASVGDTPEEALEKAGVRG